MKIFLDANILVTVLCNEYPLFTSCARVLSLADNSRFIVCTSPLSLAIGFYFAEKKSGSSQARKKIAVLSEKLQITEIEAATVQSTNANSAIEDFEDGLQYYSAQKYGCTCIVTEDKRGFYFSEIEVLSAIDFLNIHVIK
ncbi:MAG: PIN domain-containing protein [Bacteroidia bacterium]